MKLSVIIVNYNVQYFLENCLNSVVKAAKNMSCEVFVVDNNSVDGSVEMVREKFPKVKLIANQVNLGFSKANNQAIKQANGEYVLLLNPDTVVEENTFQCCVDFFENNPKAGGLGVKMLDGKGKFLPESKRGLPTPVVAFYKIFGLARLFPKSERFGQYHLGHLSNDKNHEIEILSGAFMMIRKSVLDQIGLLDENFFMYGEDIDLSYRITQAGYKNHYLADTSIIHYKGESTKKSSINYVFVFYKAMAIFARKHFSAKNAKLFSFLIHWAIYLRAGLAVLSRTLKHAVLPLLDAAFLVVGVFWFTNYYETEVKQAPNYYPEEVDLYGIPLMVGIYLLVFLFNGAYQIPTKFSRIIRSAFSGSLFVLIIYALLDEGLRFSRAIILFSVLWSLFIIPAYRFVLHLLRIRPFEKATKSRLAIIGKKDEAKRISKLIRDTIIEPEVICYIKVGDESNDKDFSYHGKIEQIEDIIEIYDINEVVFCSQDISAAEIIEKMASISSPDVDFKIAPPKSLYIIGSNSNQSSGEYYIMSTNALIKPVNQRNKRFLDFCMSLFFLLLFPIFIWFTENKSNYFSNLLNVLIGKISFVGFASAKEMRDYQLRTKQGLLTPLNRFTYPIIDEERIESLNLEYIRNYSTLKDLDLIFKNLRKLGADND
jgi:GT2 family glycosyltransferase